MVARTADMARRVLALLSMVALVGLLVVLMWRVYLHHEHGSSTEEPAIVCYPFRAA
jgi:hypothetical protein